MKFFIASYFLVSFKLPMKSVPYDLFKSTVERGYYDYYHIVGDWQNCHNRQPHYRDGKKGM